MLIVNQISIFDYVDYRDFIKDIYLVSKATNKSFSLNLLARKVKVSKVAIKYIIDKKRHISEENTVKFSKILFSNHSEREYFKHLVGFTKAKNKSNREMCLKKMLRYSKSPFGEFNISNTDVGFFQKWSYPIIAEMSYLKDYKKDPKWIQKNIKFKISLEEIRKALSFLDQNGYLKDGSKGNLKKKTNPLFRSLVYTKYISDLIDKSKEAVEIIDSSEREMFNISISVDRKRYELAKNMISEFRHQLHDILASDVPCDDVIQINMQMFKVASSIPDKKKENLA